MTIYRIPVIDVRGPGTGPSPIIHALPCIGCAPQRAAHLAANPTGDASFTCPNLRAGDPTKCAKTCFLYPRLVRGGRWHFHQGIDVGGQEGISKIISVTDGEVFFARNERTTPDHYTGYGKVVVIHSEPYYYLYAHCAEVFVATGDTVRQQDQIATVGTTQYLRDGRERSDTMGPHLHFEVSNVRYPVASGETTLDNPTGGGRIDPRAHLERLSAWGPKKFYFPLVSGGADETANEISVESTQRLYEATEQDNLGGYFPLGANNIWHGGIHLRGDADALVRAPFDAKVVAVRLDPDPMRALGAFGSLNFVLLHHELPEHITARLRNSRPPTRESWRGAVGRYIGRARRRREVPNGPEHVREVKQLLHELGFYNPDEPALLENGSADEAFFAAIVEFQRTFVRSPDGVVDIPGSTYQRLREQAEARQREREAEAARARGEPPPRPNMVYSLLMHLRPEALEDALLRQIPWLARVRLEPNEAERQREEAERAERAARREAQIAEDGADRNYALTADVGPPRRRRGPTNNPLDIAWVQRRLIRHGAFSGATDGQWSEPLATAIRQFQTQHVRYYQAGRAPDAMISAGGRTGSTEETLRITPAELEEREHDPDAGGSSTLDRRFVARATEQNPDTGVARVVTGLDVTILAGEAVWTAGVGLAFTEVLGDAGSCGRGIATRGTDASTTQPTIHWEIFTEEPLIGAWERIDDDRDDDLAVDVPSLINRAQADADAAAEPFDEAYDDPAEAPAEGETAPAEAEGEALGEDDVLSTAEIRAFYASERSRFLRQTQCRFNSEWGLNLSNTVAALRELGWQTRCLESLLAPYMWWSEADDAVPASPLVWHYNPIAFMEQYFQLFPQPAPSTLTPAAEAAPADSPAADVCDVPERQVCE